MFCRSRYCLQYSIRNMHLDYQYAMSECEQMFITKLRTLECTMFVFGNHRSLVRFVILKFIVISTHCNDPGY